MDTQGDYYRLTCDALREIGRQRGYAREGSKVALKARLATTDAVGRKRNCDEAQTMDTSEILPGQRNRAMRGAADKLDGPPAKKETRCSLGDLHMASVAKMEIA